MTEYRTIEVPRKGLEAELNKAASDGWRFAFLEPLIVSGGVPQQLLVVLVRD